MHSNRRTMTVRIVPLESRDAGDARVGGTVTERIRLVATLSELSWANTRRPLPEYTRATMPVVISPMTKPPHAG